MKIFIATPMYGGMCTGQYTSSLLELVSNLGALGHEVIYSKVYNESLITRARNAMANEFLASDCDYLLFIDADHGFKANEIVKMIDSDVDLIGAIYPMKSVNWERIMAAHGLGKKDLEKYGGYFSANLKQTNDGKTTIVLDKPFEVDNVATGMMLIKRNVFEKMIPSCETYSPAKSNGIIDHDKKVYEFFKTEISKDKTLLSEDYYFCKKWQELGGAVYAAPWVQITHFGSYEFSGSFAMSIMLQAEIEAKEEKEIEAKKPASKKSKK
jgi:hypothetical protein